MNPDLSLTRPYPFTRLRALLANSKLPDCLEHISLSIGEPKHPMPSFVMKALDENSKLFEKYPATNSAPELREAISAWLFKRYGAKVDPLTEIVTCNGSREALFSFTQALVDRTRDAVVLIPSPFYQIYEGAAYLAGATPVYCPTTVENNFIIDTNAIPEETLKRTQLLFVCSPSNPTGKVLNLEDWANLFELADRYNFVIGSDECYSEIYFDEDNPPVGALQAASQLGRNDFDKIVVFSSLSKRSNVPGMRSGFVAGDAKLIKPYLLYRTYHGCSMPGPIQKASIAAWSDEEHVRENRRLYKEKFQTAVPLMGKTLGVWMPDASFYLWARTPIEDDQEYAKKLYEQKAITVLPGSFLGREINGVNPARGYVRIALVATVEEVKEASKRISEFQL